MSPRLPTRIGPPSDVRASPAQFTVSWSTGGEAGAAVAAATSGERPASRARTLARPRSGLPWGGAPRRWPPVTLRIPHGRAPGAGTIGCSDPGAVLEPGSARDERGHDWSDRRLPAGRLRGGAAADRPDPLAALSRLRPGLRASVGDRAVERRRPRGGDGGCPAPGGDARDAELLRAGRGRKDRQPRDCPRPRTVRRPTAAAGRPAPARRPGGPLRAARGDGSGRRPPSLRAPRGPMARRRAVSRARG